ncbi:MAG: alpha-amylase [Muribaculaceae bacterium]|nr:alpha-amylase [Muribaculaceae bacterium]
MNFKLSWLSGLLIAGSSVCPSLYAANYAWPAKYEGVMLQGFFWDSYKGDNNSKWSTLTNDADELSQYFKAIWVPNSAKAASNPSMGYDPVYWFTNHTSSFGSETQLRRMISTFKEKGTDIIEDVVINHRSGVSNWTNFPTETWNGKTYKLGPEHICRNDEVKDAAGQATPTGAYDTGENFDGSRDLDHTSPTVQDNITDYCRFLLTDLGYSGFRYDMVKGYGGQYVKIYNEASKPKYSVGEYFDGNYDKVAAWIEATGKQSAAFDFPLKFVLNDAFSSNDMSKLCWMANGTNPQPAGMIHFGYQQYSVTFVDNHDTYRDHNKFNGNILAANAFILCSPGTPCVFLRHWQDYKAQLKPMIEARNAVGIHNQSPVTVLRHDRDCYMAEVTGTKGKLVVKIGSAMASPAGYTDSQIKASGNGYCIWSTAKGGGNIDPVPGTYPADMYLIGNLPSGSWDTTSPIKADKADTAKGTYNWNDVTISEASAGAKGYFSFVTKKGADWNVINSGDRYGAESSDLLIKKGSSANVNIFYANGSAASTYAWCIEPGRYSFSLDLKNSKLYVNDYSGISEIEEENTTEEIPVYFNLQGVRVENPTHGLYIMVVNGKSEKVIL